MKEDLITTQEAMALLGFDDKRIFYSRPEFNTHRRYRDLYDSKAIEQLSSELIEIGTVPDGYFTINQMIKLFPDFVKNQKTPYAKYGNLKKHLKALEPHAILIRKKNSLRAWNYYPLDEAKKIIEKKLEESKHDGFIDGKQVRGLLSLFINPDLPTYQWNNKLKSLSKKTGIELNTFNGHKLGNKGATGFYSKASIEELICECIENL